MKRNAIKTSIDTLAILFILSQLMIAPVSAQDITYSENPQSQNFKSDDRLLRINQIKEEQKKAFADFNKKKAALKQESIERINAIDGNLDYEQRAAKEREIQEDIKAKKRKVFKAYQEHYDSLTNEKDALRGIDRSSSSSGDIKRRLKAAPGYNSGVTPTYKRKSKTSGYNRRQKTRNKSSRPKSNRGRSRGSRKGSY